MRRALELSDILLPNSEEEMRCVVKDFGGNLPGYRVIFNAVDRDTFKPQESVLDRNVICCARIDPNKNQLALIKAVRRIPGISLTLLGERGSSDMYYKRVRKLMVGSKFKLLEGYRDAKEVANIVKNYSVHALPSFRESPGLSSLEALSCGLNAVVSDSTYCPVQTYFGNQIEKKVFTADPYSITSIESALRRALFSESNTEVLSDMFEWSYVGKQTLGAYNAIF